MKKTTLLATVALGLLLTACGSENKSGSTADTTVTAPVKRGPQPAEPEITRQYSATIAGHLYAVSVHRVPDAQLPTVKDEIDQEFYDNRVSVDITCDGNNIFSQTFTKADFEGFKNRDTAGMILLGMAFDEEKSDARHLYLAAQVGQPGTGEGPAFTIEVPISGGNVFSVLVDTQQDTNNPGTAEANAAQ